MLDYLSFDPRYADLAERLAEAVTGHATPVGSGTVARTGRIPRRAGPRRRPGSSGMNQAFGAWQHWQAAERGRWLALSAALAARAAALPDDGTVTAAEWRRAGGDLPAGSG